jgi:ABC-type transport system involved in multi-copper enzyme maturation permease subunit
MAKTNIKTKKQPKFPLYNLERKLNLTMLLIFAVITGILIFITLILYPQIKEGYSELSGMFENSGIDFAAIIGVENISSYFTMQSAQNWGMLAAVYAAVLGNKLVASNFKEGSSTYLYSLNMSRTKILNNKLLRLVINIVIFNIICAIFAVIALYIVGESFNLVNMLIYTLFSILVTLQIGVLTFALTAITNKISTFIAVLLPIALGIISSLALMSENLKFLKYFGPFETLFSNVLIDGFGAINYVIFALWTAIPVLTLIYSYIRFNKKDLI